MPATRILFLVGLLALAVAMAGCRRDRPAAQQQADDAAHTGDEAHGEGHGEDVVMLSESQMRFAEIETAEASLGEIGVELLVLGEVALNQDHLAHIAPRVTGIIREVRKTLGDRVTAGDVMAVLDSRELADAKSEFLAARERLALAQANHDREEGLFRQKVSAEQDYLDARQALAEARIALRSSEQKLRALGVAGDEIVALPGQSEQRLTRYEIRAPFDGTVIKKHITRGEHVQAEAELYTLCDLRTVWVIASVYEKDIARVRVGQAATLRVKAYPARIFQGKVTWIADTIDEATRTLKIRLELRNEDGSLKAGMFARIALAVDTRQNILIVHPSAVQTQRGEPVVFVAKGGGHFERREVRLGIRSEAAIEILDGLNEGERLVTSGSFILKSELEKEGFQAGHAH